MPQFPILIVHGYFRQGPHVASLKVWQNVWYLWHLCFENGCTLNPINQYAYVLYGWKWSKMVQVCMTWLKCN